MKDSILGSLRNISIFFGNFLSRMGMFHWFWVLFSLFNLHVECELHNSEFKFHWKTLRNVRVQEFGPG